MKLLEQKPPFVLFADDDPGTLDIFRAYCRALGWQGEFVATAGEIIEAVNRNCDDGRCYDALVADVHFFDETPAGGPRISGIAAARVVKETHPDLPIVFVSGYSSYLLRDAARDVGAEFFQKPVDFEKLFGRVAYLIRWNRVVAPPETDTQDRRPVEVPPVLKNAIDEVRAKRSGEQGEQERKKSAGGPGH